MPSANHATRLVKQPEDSRPAALLVEERYAGRRPQLSALRSLPASSSSCCARRFGHDQLDCDGASDVKFARSRLQARSRSRGYWVPESCRNSRSTSSNASRAPPGEPPADRDSAAIARAIAEAHGGTLTLAGPIAAHKTRFIADLPVADRPPGTSRPPGTPVGGAEARAPTAHL
jgi:hypothetical protein